MEALSFAAATISLGQQTKQIIKAVSRFRASAVDRRLLNRLQLFERIIRRGQDVLPRALEDEPFRRDQSETVNLCLYECTDLIFQLQRHIDENKKSGLFSFRTDKHISELLSSLELWSKILFEEMNQWKITDLQRMIREGLEYQAQTRYMVEDFVWRYYQDHPGVDMSRQQNTACFMRRGGEEQGSSAPTTRNDPQHSIEEVDTTDATSAPDPMPHLSRVSQGLEQVSERLRQLSRWGTERPFLFPFVIVPDDPHVAASAPFRVKLDSGCDLNWISLRILKRVGLEDKQEEAKCDRAWLGFSGGEELIVPQATITLTWYSVNAAYTHRHEFLVHDQVPFDVVLGSEFIIEEGWKKSFNDPVLALRYSELSDEQLSEIHHRARQNQDATDAQRQAEREMRSRDRQARRQLGLSRTGTSRSFLSPARSQALSRRMSMATVAGYSALTRSPLSAQQSQTATSETPSISESPRPLPPTTTQPDALPSDLGESSALPSVRIETVPGQDTVEGV